ncbi:AraC family transcriptional regulator, partial [Acinetobacter baumannii]
HYYALTITIQSLNVRTQHSDTTLVKLLVKQAEEALVQRKIHDDLVQQIHWILQEYFKHKQQAPKIEDIAIELSASGRRLQSEL